ncbi:MAG: hypothetical protein DMF49_05665 [Acidobacteria bacterium]|nr:MAG: hypothetical protein DMF49_05665 [Acidobacteriota bacterium]
MDSSCLTRAAPRGETTSASDQQRRNMNQSSPTISPEERTLAALTHLSGLSGYLIPLGGILVPIVIWAVKKDSRIISSIARQAVLLNLAVFFLIAATAILLITIILIPAVLVFWALLLIAAVALPIVGAIRAWEGTYFRYPVVGSTPI